MKSRLSRLTLVLALLTWTEAALAQATAPSGAQANPSSAIPQVANADVQAFVDGVATEEMNALGTPGLGVAIVTTDGQRLLRTYGFADRNGPIALDPDKTIFHIASTSKTFIAVALMRAVEKGVISLDAPANSYLDFKLPTYPGAREITVRDLTRHEAGFEERWLATGGGAVPDPRPWSEILAKTFPKLIAPPGAYASYSNYGAGLLGYIIQRATGIKYEQYLKEQVFDPLAMSSSTVEESPPPELSERIVDGWRVAGGVLREGEPSSNRRTFPAGRVKSTLSDMSRYMMMLLSGGMAPDGTRLLTQDSVDALLTGTSRAAPEMPGMGIIFAEKDIAGLRVVGHGGDGDILHTDLIMSRQHGFGIFTVHFSAPGPNARDFFTRAIIGRIVPGAGVPFLPLPPSGNRFDLGKYAGQYRHYRWAFTSIERVLQLTSEFSVKDSGMGSLIVTGRLSPGEYVMAGRDGLFQERRTGELLYLHPGVDGRMTLNMGTFPFVTAYKLDTIDTQSFTFAAYWVFVCGLGLLGAVALGFALADWVRRNAIHGAGFAILGAGLAASAFALWDFVAVALSLSELEIQQHVPPVAYPILAVPPVCTVLVLIFVAGWAQGAFRPQGVWQGLITSAAILLFGLFIAFLAHWHGFGWMFP